MKKYGKHILVLVLTLIIANTGFARADLQICQTECEYSALNNTSQPPCCKSKKTVTPVMVMVEHDRTSPEDCPHFGSDRKISDPLTFISTANTTPEPNFNAALSVVMPAMMQIPDTRFSGYYIHSGLSPPGVKSHPLYRLNCSLLI